MEPPQCGVDPLDYSTRLPPRKRLLANLKKNGPPPESPTPSIHFNTSELRARIQDLLNSSASFPDDGIEVSRSIASEAREVAVAARAAAVEKAKVAARARAFAKSVLEVIASLPRCLDHEDSCSSVVVQGKRQKQIAVRHLYDSKVPLLTCGGGDDEYDDDERLARRLHQSVNSSPRITKFSNTKKSSRKDYVVDVCAKSSSLPCEVDKNWVPTDPEIADSDTHLKASHCASKNGTGIKSTIVKPGRKVRIKRKKLPLSQFDSANNNRGAIAAHDESSKSHSISTLEERKYDPTPSPPSPIELEKHSSAGDVSGEKEPVLNRKKLKLSQLYSGKKILHHPLGSKARLSTASAVV